MAAPVTGSFPGQVDIDAGFIIRFTALSPTDGSVVAGVTISNAAILAQPVDVTTGEPEPPSVPGDVAPLFVPIPADQLG